MSIPKHFPPVILPAWIAVILGVCCCAAVLAQAPATPAARPEPAAARLEITGAVQTPLSFSAADLKTMPRTKVRIGGQNGQAPQVYEGVALSELLQRAGVPQGGDLGGEWMAAYALATAEDGYRVTFSLSEMNPGIGAVEVLVADTLDGAPLGQGQGPFRLVVPSDKRAARWVRVLKSITIAGM